MTLTPPLDTLRLSERERDTLLQIKRLTGIEHWNVLCRWALCISLAEGQLPPAETEVPSDSNLEMAWHTFAGDSAIAFMVLLGDVGASTAESQHERARRLRRHLARGIALLHARVQADSLDRRARPSRLAALL